MTINQLANAMSERELQGSVVDLAKHLQLWVWHPFDMRRSEPGWPDLTILGRGAIFAELKSMRGQLTREQRTVGYRLQAAGLRFVVWQPVDWLDGTIRNHLEMIA
jgi:hypothetical protein